MGKIMGAPPKEKSENYETVKAAYENGLISLTEAGYLCKVARDTFRKWLLEDDPDAIQKRQEKYHAKPENYEAVKTDFIEGKITAKQAAELLGITDTTFSKWVTADDPDAIQKNRENRPFTPRKEKPDNFISIKDDWVHGIISSRQAAVQCGVAKDTFQKWVEEDFPDDFSKWRALIAEKKRAKEEEKRQKAEEKAVLQKANEEEKRRKAEEMEALRKAKEEERKRKALEMEAKLKAREEAGRRKAEEMEALRKAKEEKRRKAEEERRRIAEEKAALKQAKEEERTKLQEASKPQQPRPANIRPTPWANRVSKDNIVSLTKEQIAATNRVLDTVRETDFDDTERLARIISDMSAYCHKYDPPTPEQLLDEWIEKDGYELTAKELAFAKDVAIYILSKPRIHRLLEYKLEVLEGARRFMKENRYLLDTSMTA